MIEYKKIILFIKIYLLNLLTELKFSINKDRKIEKRLIEILTVRTVI